MEISLNFGRSLGPFVLGNTLFSSIETTHHQLPESKASVLYNQAGHDVILITSSPREDAYTLKFDPALQLLRSVAYSLPKTPTRNERLEFRGTHSVSLKHPLSIRDALDNFGKPLRFHIGNHQDGKVAHLLFDGMCFVFHFQNPAHRKLDTLQDLTAVKSRLIEIRIAPPEDSKLFKMGRGVPRPEKLYNLPEVYLVVHKPSKSVVGLEISYVSTLETSQSASTKSILFSEKCEDVLAKLGTPDRIYYKDLQHWAHIGMLANYSKPLTTKSDVVFGYPHLGLDIVLDSVRNTVSKFVLHTNVPNHPEFCSQSRCLFSLSLSEDGLATNSSGETLFVSPTTSWGVIQSHLKSKHTRHLRRCHYSPSTNSFYPFPDTHLWALFDQLIVETTSSESLAKITILPPDLHVMVQSRTPQNITVHRGNKLPLHMRAVEGTYESLTSRLDSDDDCQEDSFHSAKSSLASTDLQALDLTKKNKPRTGRVSENAYFPPNVNTVICSKDDSVDFTQGSSTVPLPCEVSDIPKSVVYEFLKDSPQQSDIKSNPPVTAVLYESQTLSIVTEASPYAVVIQSGDPTTSGADCLPDLEPTAEQSSFDLISDGEILESQKAMARSDSLSVVIQSSDGHESTFTRTPLPGTPEGQQTSVLPEGSNLENTSQSAEDAFHYQPKAGAMIASRIMILSQDVGLLSRNTEPEAEINTRRMKANVKSNFESSRMPSQSSRISGSCLEGNLIVQKKGGSSVSAREEARRRLMSHTKSSQQRVKPKYVPAAEVDPQADTEQENLQEEGGLEATDEAVKEDLEDSSSLIPSRNIESDIRQDDRHGQVNSTPLESNPPDRHGPVDSAPLESSPPDRHGAVDSTPLESSPPDRHGPLDTTPLESNPPDRHGAVDSTPLESNPPDRHGAVDTTPLESNPPDRHGQVNSTPLESNPPDRHGPVDSAPLESSPPDGRGPVDSTPLESSPPDRHGPVDSTPPESNPPDRHGPVDRAPLESSPPDRRGPVDSTPLESNPPDSFPDSQDVPLAPPRVDTDDPPHQTDSIGLPETTCNEPRLVHVTVTQTQAPSVPNHTPTDDIGMRATVCDPSDCPMDDAELSRGALELASSFSVGTNGFTVMPDGYGPPEGTWAASILLFHVTLMHYGTGRYPGLQVVT